MKKSFFFAALMMSAFVLVGCDKGGTPETDSTKLWPAQEDESTTWGYFNGKDAKLAIRAKYSSAENFSCGYALVKEDQDWKFIDKSGTVVSAKMPELDQYTTPGTFYYDYSVISVDQLKAFMNKDFKKVTTKDFQELGTMTADGLAYFKIKDETTYGYCDKDGEIVIKAIYDSAEPFMDGIAVVKQVSEDHSTTTYIIIDTKGKELYSQKDYMSNLGEGRVLFQKDNGKCGMLDKNGNEVLSATYASIDEFSDGLAKVRKYTEARDGKYGYIDVKGVEKIETVYASGRECQEGLIWVKKASNSGDGKWMLIDKNGADKFELSKNQSPVTNYHNGLARISGQNKMFYIDKNNEEKYSWKTGNGGGGEYYPQGGEEENNPYYPGEEDGAPARKARLAGTKLGPKAEYNLEHAK